MRAGQKTVGRVQPERASPRIKGARRPTERPRSRFAHNTIVEIRSSDIKNLRSIQIKIVFFYQFFPLFLLLLVSTPNDFEAYAQFITKNKIYAFCFFPDAQSSFLPVPLHQTVSGKPQIPHTDPRHTHSNTRR